MPTILYNTNSSLIPKYRRSNTSIPYKGLLSKKGHTRLRSKPSNNVYEENTNHTKCFSGDVPFQSEFEKDSVEYLQELCRSVYPSSLHQRIRNLEDLSDLQINAFAALIFKNFIKSWYGVKIPTNDSKFLTELYNMIQDLVQYMKSSRIDYSSLLLDYIPCLLSSHLTALEDCAQTPDLVYEQYCQLTLYDSKRYPSLFIDIIQSKFNTKSLLQRSFVDSFLNGLVFGHILDSIMEPYYFLDGLNRICMNVKLSSATNIKENYAYGKIKCGPWWFVSIKQKISRAAKLISYSTSIRLPNLDTSIIPEIPFLQRYIFTFIITDFFKLSMRKPFLFSVCMMFQYCISKSKSLNKVMYNIFANTVKAKITSPMTIGNLFLSLRHSLFPNDNTMGPPKVIPIGNDFLKFREECICNLWHVCITYKLDKIFAIKKSDIADLVVSLSKNKECNKLLLYRIIDCIAAQLP
ncbi:YDR179W-A [Saccharomyces arboricola H-6]|uniref:YDR179W-A n=1 Tax=Saccharomyces arboricola (strain H-6 / AS 2.3317 / CBS 10644) TaxID=1160507 RepID=J8Q418_SACAR|nr:YDR179W-A [Saccharomyces arboricola H-6]